MKKNNETNKPKTIIQSNQEFEIEYVVTSSVTIKLNADSIENARKKAVSASTSSEIIKQMMSNPKIDSVIPTKIAESDGTTHNFYCEDNEDTLYLTPFEDD